MTWIWTCFYEVSKLQLDSHHRIPYSIHKPALQNLVDLVGGPFYQHHDAYVKLEPLHASQNSLTIVFVCRAPLKLVGED